VSVFIWLHMLYDLTYLQLKLAGSVHSGSVGEHRENVQSLPGYGYSPTVPVSVL